MLFHHSVDPDGSLDPFPGTRSSSCAFHGPGARLEGAPSGRAWPEVDLPPRDAFAARRGPGRQGVL
eukprot:6204269-Pyramimonas_sp.AAC.1